MKPYDEDLPPENMSIFQELFFYLYKPLYHLRLFLQQRAMLREDPGRAVTPPPEVPAEHWVPPGFFALEGLLVTTLVVELLSGLFSFFFVRPAPYQQRIFDFLDNRVRNYWFFYDRAQNAQASYVAIPSTHQYAPGDHILLADLDRPPTFPSSVPILADITLAENPMSFYPDGQNIYFTVDGYKQALVQVINQLQLERSSIPLPDTTLETMSHWLGIFSFPISLLVSSIFFQLLFLRTRDGRQACNCEKIPQIYLYMTTAVFFWPNIINATYTGLLQFLAIYSGWYDHGAMAAYMAGGQAAMASTLLQYDGELAALQLIVIVPIGLVALHRLSKTIRGALCLPPAPPFLRDGVIGSVYFSNVINVLAVTFAIGVITSLAMTVIYYIQAHQINLILKRWL